MGTSAVEVAQAAVLQPLTQETDYATLLASLHNVVERDLNL